MGAVVGRGMPVRFPLRGPAGSGGGADTQRPELVEGEGAVRPMGERVFDAVSAYGLISPVAYGRTSPAPVADCGSAAGISVEIDVPTRDTRAMSRSTSSEPIERGWDEPWYRVRMEGFEASFLPSDGEDLDEVCNVDVFVTLEDESRWTATVFTVAEVERLMKLWAGTDEALGGRYFWVSDGLIVRDPGIDSMTDVIAGLIENGEFSEIFQPVINN